MLTNFLTWQEKYLCAEGYSQKVVADRTNPQGWETFTPESREDGTVAFKTDHGTYLCAEGDGRLTHRTPGTEDGSPGPWESFRTVIIEVPALPESAVVALQTAHGTYVVVEADGLVQHRVPGGDGEPGAWECFRVTPWWIGAQPGYRVPAGIVRKDGYCLRDDVGYMLGGTVSYFHGPRTFERDRARFDADIITLKQMNADAVRVITDLGWPGDREQNGPDNIPRLVDTMRTLYQNGIRTQVTILGSLFGSRRRTDGSVEWGTLPYRLDNQAARKRYANALCDALAGIQDHIFIIEICNEPENGGVGPLSRPDQAELQRLVKQRLPGVIVTLGAPGGLGATSWSDEDYRWYGQNGDMVLPHLDRGYRDMGWGCIHQGIHSAQAPFTWGDNEPIGPYSSVRSETDPTKLRMGRNFAWVTKAGFTCYHPYSGIGLGWDSDYPLAEEPGIFDCFKGRQVLPADLPNFGFHNWHWASNPVETLEGCWADHPATNTGTIRTLGSTKSDGRRVISVLKVAPGGATLRFRETLRLNWFVFDSGGYVQFDGGTYARGDTFRLPAGAPEIFGIGEVA